jgi:hypothetical protein
MARKTKGPSRVDLTAKQADYASWKLRAAADLANRHDVKPGIIPERLWRRLYNGGSHRRRLLIRPPCPPTTHGHLLIG